MSTEPDRVRSLGSWCQFTVYTVLASSQLIRGSAQAQLGVKDKLIHRVPTHSPERKQDDGIMRDHSLRVRGAFGMTQR
jgi:hypothetical protein